MMYLNYRATVDYRIKDDSILYAPSLSFMSSNILRDKDN